MTFLAVVTSTLIPGAALIAQHGTGRLHCAWWFGTFRGDRIAYRSAP